MKLVKHPAKFKEDRFFKTVPMVDAEGNPVQQNPPLNKEGFWDKPITTSSILNEQINKRKKRKH